MKTKLIKSLAVLIVPTFLVLSLNTQHEVDYSKAEVVIEKADLARLQTMAFGKDASTTMTFTWNTTNYTNTVVKVVEEGESFDGENVLTFTGNIELSKASGEDGYIHRVIATGLTPDTKYNYYIDDLSTNEQIGSFKTSSTGNKNFSFMHISDPQGTTEADYLSYNRLLETSTSNFSFDFIALTGDIVNNSWKDHSPALDQWEWALTDQYSILKDYPLMTVSGNHEAASYDFSSRFTYETSDEVRQSGVYYSFVYEGVYFLALNTNEGLAEEPGSSLSEAQLNFVRQDLEAHKSMKWKVVLMHKGLFDAGSHSSNIAEGEDYDIEYYRHDLAPLFTEYGVDLVLQGHDHLYSKSYPIESKDIDGVVTHSVKADVIVENSDGVKYAYKPNAPIYLNTGSASGSKYYGVNQSEEMSRLIDFAFNPMCKLFTNIEVDQENNRLTFKTYKQENDTYELYQAYGINKGEMFDNGSGSSDPTTPGAPSDTQIDLPLIITLSVVGGVVLVAGIIASIVIIRKRRNK